MDAETAISEIIRAGTQINARGTVWFAATVADITGEYLDTREV